jgi:UDP-N-acetylglucosamine diphosphorylase/glucosamine-1-phosphate N-acetyltransferase
MNFVLFDDPVIRPDLLPFTFTRPVAEIRVGILTIREKWEKFLGQPVSAFTQDYLKAKFPLVAQQDNVLINGAVCPDENLVRAIPALKTGESLTTGSLVIAARTPEVKPLTQFNLKPSGYSGNITVIDQVWKVFQHNAQQIRSDYSLMTHRRETQRIEDPHTRIYAPESIFVEEGAVIQAAVLNASAGPIYIGRNAQVQEGALIRGPFSLGEESVVNMGAKIKGDSTVGPHCKVGGEISNSVIFGYSNKAHDGFLGNSVIGEWCNLGADTNTSNLKNNYDAVKLWNYQKGGFKNTGLTFCGLMMGDHSKCGINTMFNTGSVAGVSANIFGDGYPRNFIPSFAWGGAAGFTTFQLDKAYETASKAMARRGQKLTDADKGILKTIFESTASERVWEKKS